MTPPTPIVHVVDDDDSLRTAVTRLLRAAGHEVRAYPSAGEFLLAQPAGAPGCVVLDVQMPGPSGLDLQEAFARLDGALPIIFLTGHGDIPMSVRAMKAGAVDFLTKPVQRQALLDAVRVAVDRDRSRREEQKEMADLKRRFDSLTSREQEVISLVVVGMLNKQIAAQLGTAESTVKVQRSRAMEKMHAASLAELIKMIEKVKAPLEKAS